MDAATRVCARARARVCYVSASASAHCYAFVALSCFNVCTSCPSASIFPPPPPPPPPAATSRRKRPAAAAVGCASRGKNSLEKETHQFHRKSPEDSVSNHFLSAGKQTAATAPLHSRVVYMYARAVVRKRIFVCMLTSEYLPRQARDTTWY